MRELDQLILIIPGLLNLNGNIEMNLSARLGTAANVGELDDPAVRNLMITGNMNLLQVQTISVAFVSACVSLLLGMILPRQTTTAKTLATRRAPFNLHSPRRVIPRPSGDSKHKTSLITFVLTYSSQYIDVLINID